jgi:hypothetical protein
MVMTQADYRVEGGRQAAAAARLGTPRQLAGDG